METVSSFSHLPCAIFLKEFKQLVQQGNFLPVDRLKNREALAALGLTTENQKEILLSLRVEDYSSGPDPDRDEPGEVWEFGKNIGGNEIYIKLKIHDQGRRKVAKCISFHIAEHDVCYPYKTSR